MINIKSRKQKAKLYESKYSEIPRDYIERLSWMYDKYHITKAKAEEILRAKYNILSSLYYSDDILVVLYEEPEGSPRPRARYVNKTNLTSYAKSDPGYIQVYSLTGASDRKFMKRLIDDNDLMKLDHLICTPCDVEYNTFSKTPSSYNTINTFLSEVGIIRPVSKPDFDNMEKKYADMYNGNVWIDDALVQDAAIHKYYSILPRVEIRLKFLNLLYTKAQYEQIIKRVEDPNIVNYCRY